MNLILLSYDLRDPGRNYEPLYREIKKMGTAEHVLKSVWLLKTQLNTVEIRDTLVRFLDSNDGIIVCQLNGAAAWQNVDVDNNTVKNVLSI